MGCARSRGTCCGWTRSRVTCSCSSTAVATGSSCCCGSATGSGCSTSVWSAARSRCLPMPRAVATPTSRSTLAACACFSMVSTRRDRDSADTSRATCVLQIERDAMGVTNGQQHGQQAAESPTTASAERLIALIAQKDEKIATLERHVARLIDELTKIRGVQFGEDVAQRSIKAAVESLLQVPGALPFPGLAAAQKQVEAA